MMQSILAHVNERQQSLILITHKPLLLRQMNKIVLMQEGKINDSGSHQQLPSGNLYYRQLLSYF
ncbi:MAG: hypothetical protein HRU04_08220 [Oceanospirillaceae bacterium]|nr:hypothetical protein [Oceanospirillaceae bacterium]